MQAESLLSAAIFPLWLKTAYTVMTVVVLVVYYFRRGPANYLWFSDIALIGMVPALWFENTFLASLMACAVLIPEALWGVSFFGRLLFGLRLIGLADYMFEEKSPRWLRSLSLFHVPLLLVLLWAVWRLGYDTSVLPWAVAMAWVVLPVTRLVSGPERNINHVYRLPVPWGAELTSGQRLAVLMVGVPLLFHLPAHLLLWGLFG